MDMKKMASVKDSSSPFSELSSSNAVHCWILDYYCQSTLQEWAHKFEPYSNRYVRASNFVGNFSGQLVVSNHLQFKLELVSLLPQLHNLPKKENPQAYTEILQEIQATNNICPESLTKETQDFFNQLKKQCLLLCCQKVGFSAATQIYEGFDDNEKLDEESDRELSDILKSENSEDDRLQCDIPSSISAIVSGYLQNHVIPSSTPFLNKAATEALKEEEEQSFQLSPQQMKTIIQPKMLIQLAKEFDQGSSSSCLYLDNSEKEIYLKKLKSNWKKNHLKYHQRLRKFEDELFSPEREKPMVAHRVERLRRSAELSPALSSSPVASRFPEMKTIQMRQSLKPPVTKKKRSQGRSHRIPWTSEQEEEFYRAVLKKGLGNWCEIRDCITFHKTNVNLKDKWRSFEKSGRMRSFAKKFGKI